MFDQANTKKEVEKAFINGRELLNQIPKVSIPEGKRIRIGIVGEIYVVMEASINMKIEEVLGSLGAEVERSQYLTQWINYNILPSFINHSHETEILKKVKDIFPLK